MQLVIPNCTLILTIESQKNQTDYSCHTTSAWLGRRSFGDRCSSHSHLGKYLAFLCCFYIGFILNPHITWSRIPVLRPGPSFFNGCSFIGMYKVVIFHNPNLPNPDMFYTYQRMLKHQKLGIWTRNDYYQLSCRLHMMMMMMMHIVMKYYLRYYFHHNISISCMHLV